MNFKRYNFLPLFLGVSLLFSSCSKPERPVLVPIDYVIGEETPTTSVASLADISEQKSTSTESLILTETKKYDFKPLSIPVVSGYAMVKESIPILDIYNYSDLESSSLEGLTNPGPFDGVRTLKTTGETNGKFIEVVLPRLPNGTKGWVLSKDVDVFYGNKKIVVDLSDRTARIVTSVNCSILNLSEIPLMVCKNLNDQVLVEVPVAIGKESTPTPVLEGIVDVLWERSNSFVEFGPVYGDRLFGLNQHSEVLDNFGGKRPAIAIHSTSSPELIGGRVSNGCIRMKPEDIDIFVEHVTLGMNVQIVE